KKLFNQKESKWVRKVSHPKKIIPSDQEAYEKYIDIMRITENKQTSFVTLSIDHESPIMAKNWVEIIIKNINQSMREEEEKKAQSSINFLNESAKLTNIQSLKDAISSLLESQMQILMLAASNDDYIFKIIDSPIAPEEKSSPRRALICIIGTLLGVALSLFITFFQYYREAYRKS
ncbi:MAG: LPS O-antigen length regulator, partial [Gammaproteobacteria bacterium]